jgi:Flp pilus assembly protein TadG
MIRLIKSLAWDDRGASIIEMALLMPFLATLLIGVADISRAYSSKLLLEQAAYRSIEKVQQYRDTSSTFSTIQAEATSAATAAGFASPTVTVDYFLECDGTRQTTYNTTCSGTTTPNRWITVDIAGTFTPMFPSSKWPGSNTNGTYTLHGKAGLRTQ